MDDKNRVLVDLPARLGKAKAALGAYEKRFQELQILYSQRVILKDSVVLDQIGELLGAPPIPGDSDDQAS